MIIGGSVGREVNLLNGYSKGKVCIAYRKGYKKAFLIRREWFPRFKIQEKQKWKLDNYCSSLADEN